MLIRPTSRPDGSAPASMRLSFTASGRGRSWTHLLTTLLALTHVAQGAINLNVDSPDSIKAAAKTIAKDMMTFYTGDKPGGVPGLLPQPHYWWQAGAMFGGLIDYWYLTGDEAFNERITKALLHQVGPDKNFMPPNQTSTLGNDDQAFWGMAALSAAEYKFPDPPKDQPQWAALAQAVFHSQVPRWDTQSCSGGLRWQIFAFNAGYTYKNAISNGAFFNMGARLARYTNNQTYAEWAERAWDWMEKSNLVLPEKAWTVFDGSHDLENNCTETNRLQWSYNVAILLQGAAYMYNFTDGSDKWRQRTAGLLKGTDIFFDEKVKDVMVEVACENVGTCNTDQRSFKAYLARWMSAATKMAPFTYEPVMARLRASARAAAATCTAGASNTLCGLRWTTGAHDGSTGVGEQMSALETVQSLLMPQVKGPGPVTQDSGGTSKSDPNAGTSAADDGDGHHQSSPITGADKFGAAALTAVSVVLMCGICGWIVIGV